MMRFRGRAYIKRKPGTMNKTEEAYSMHLESLKRSREILDYSFEPETLKIGQDCRYTPDFRVLRPMGLYCQNGNINFDIETGFFIEFHEVKGTIRKKGIIETKPYIEDDALVKIKAAAAIHPYKFIIVWMGREGNWETREIN